MPNERYKVFDSHRRDLLGMGHPLGTCALIEIDSLTNFGIYMHKHLILMRLKVLILLKCKAAV